MGFEIKLTLPTNRMIGACQVPIMMTGPHVPPANSNMLRTDFKNQGLQIWAPPVGL